MNCAFSKAMSSTEGRFLTAIENEQLFGSSLELPHRMIVSRMLQQFEFEIVDFATHAFCDTILNFEGPSGSIRRKKGHQDGRIILRYAAQAVREGSCEVVFEKVLSWLVGHLDAANVTGQHMEIFFHFLQQGVHRELPSHAHPFVDRVFEDMIDFVRQASHSGTIHRAFRRIAEFAVDRVMTILPNVKAMYGVASTSKCKRDFELLIKEVARVMRTPSPMEMKKQFAGWLVERLMNQVEYDAEVWYWSFLALREGVVECCGPEAGMAVHDLFETMADNAEKLIHAVKLASHAGEIADASTVRLLERGEALGLLRADEFQTAVATGNRQLITELAVLHACSQGEMPTDELSSIWCKSVLPVMPSMQSSFLAANLKVLLEVVDERWKDGTEKAFRHAILSLVEIARRTETAMRLAEIVDKVAVESANWAIDNFNQFAADKRAAFRDIRLVLSKVVTLIPSGPVGVNGFEFRTYISKFLLPNLPFNVGILRQVYERVIRVLETHADAEDARVARGYLEDGLGCFDRHARLHAVAAHADRFAISAVERGYQAAPRHESLARNGVKAGRRDGKLLVQKTIDAAIIGGHEAEAALHTYFRNEQVRMSRLPGSVIVEFLRGLLEQLREYPELAELLMGLASAAPAYAGAIRINELSQSMAERISLAAVNASPAYKEQLGEKGLEACARDNAVMLRGLSSHLMSSPGDVADFKVWWRNRIGKNIRTKPENFESNAPCAKTNFNEVIQAIREVLDRDEADTIERYLKQIFSNRSSSTDSNGRSNNSRLIPTASLAAAMQPVSFADVAAMK
jgi:hypothetical protein